MFTTEMAEAVAGLPFKAPVLLEFSLWNSLCGVLISFHTQAAGVVSPTAFMWFELPKAALLLKQIKSSYGALLPSQLW